MFLAGHLGDSPVLGLAMPPRESVSKNNDPAASGLLCPT